MICALCNFKCVAYGNGRKRFDAHEHREVDGVWLKVRKKRALNNEKASKIKKRPLKSKNRAKKVSFVIKFDRMIVKQLIDRWIQQPMTTTNFHKMNVFNEEKKTQTFKTCLFKLIRKF